MTAPLPLPRTCGNFVEILSAQDWNKGAHPTSVLDLSLGPRAGRPLSRAPNHARNSVCDIS